MLLLTPFLRHTTASRAQPGRGRAQRRGMSAAELLELRSLLSATSWPGLLDPQADAEPNNTLDAATVIGVVNTAQPGEFVGSIGAGTGLSNDVDWFAFTVEAAGRVHLTALPGLSGAHSPIVLTLYGEPLAEFDPDIPLGRPLLGRMEAPDELAARLNPGTYFVAISGTGNRFFHPFLAGSGSLGEACDYGVRITTTAGGVSTPTSQQAPTDWEFSTLGDDTPLTATELGDLTASPHLQVEGTIGDDPFYNVARSNPFANNPAADVDLYQFEITGDGEFALIAEAFAGRIGSPLDPALTLFRADAAGTLQPLAVNNNTLNNTQTTDGQLPLFTDAAVFSGLTAGEYFLAVSSSGNDGESDPDNAFDPTRAHSGINGFSLGAYVLDLSIAPDADAPSVLATTPADGTTLDHTPTHLTIQFSEPVNAQQLAYLESQEASDSTARPVFIVGADGVHFFPRLQSYDPATGVAEFLMLDGLPNGASELHVSGAAGLTDLAGHPLQGNDPSGDFVARFTVAGPSRGSADGSNVWRNQPANDTLATAQELGVLFPRELQTGVSLIRDATTNSTNAADDADWFQFEFLQSRTLAFRLTNTGSSGSPSLRVFNVDGQELSLLSLVNGTLRIGFLPAGRYSLSITGWDSADAGNVTYRTTINLLGASENPTPLTSGAAPAARIQLAGSGPSVSFAPATLPFVRPSASELPPIPTGLLAGLNAPALGSQGIIAAAPDTAIVRLFGFSNRDQLFSMIDSTLRRTTESLSGTRVRLTDSELLDILNLDRDTATESDAPMESNAAESSTSDESPSDMPAKSKSKSKPNEDSDEENEPTEQPVSQILSPARRVRRSLPFEATPSDERRPATFGAPIALALATSLASSLRERTRRNPEQSSNSESLDFPA